MPRFTTKSNSTLAGTALPVVGLFSFAALVASPSPLILVASGLCLALIILLLWTPDDIPALFIMALFQWTEVAAWPISTLWKQVPLNALSSHNADLDSAALYGLLGICVLTIGLRIGVGRAAKFAFSQRVKQDAALWSYSSIARIAFFTIGAGYAAAFLSNAATPTRELFNQLSNIKYVGIFALSYWCLVRRSHLQVLLAVTVFEVIFGMTGFFAEFKNSILTLIVAAIAARPRLKSNDVVAVTVAGFLLVGVGIFWTAVKPSYRTFVNQGGGGQVVLEPIEERLKFLATFAANMTLNQFVDGADRLISRHGYIEFLGLTMQHVPAGTPHEDGQLTLALIKHITVPRFLFPDKPVLVNDTEITAKYTGLPLVSNGETSISIGYLGELYVDFGFIGALVAVGIIGLLTGRAYKLLRDQASDSALLTAGLCLIIALPQAYFGSAYFKNIGAAVFSTAIAFALQRFWLPLALARRQRLVRHTIKAIQKPDFNKQVLQVHKG